MPEKTVYLMRGLPGCGKSFTAKKLAGAQGVVLETDQYFYTETGSDPTSYDYREELLPIARQWNFQRFKDAIAEGISPVVVDRGNGLNSETAVYAKHAVSNGYHVELREPESEWWQELHVLLKYKQCTMPVLENFAEALSRKTQAGHRVPSATILRWMKRWKSDLTIDEILKLDDA